MFVLILALLAPAQAADVELSSSAAVHVRVDGLRAHRRVGEGNRWVLVLKDGEHEVEIRSLLGRSLAMTKVTVQGEERVLLHYRKGTVEEIGRGNSLAVERAARAMTEAAARATEAAATAARAEAQAAEAQARAAEAHAAAAKAGAAASAVQTLLLQPGFGEKTVGTTMQQRPVPPGGDASFAGLSAGSGGIAQASASFSGLDPAIFSLNLGGVPVDYVPYLGAFVATDLSPGTLPLTLSMEGEFAMAADFTTKAGAHTACTILVRAAGYDTGCVVGSAPITSADLLDSRAKLPAIAAAAPTMDESLLQILIATVQDAPYSRDKVGALSSAAEHHLFTCAQVVRLLLPLAYNDERLAAARALRPAIVDPQNAFLIEEVFDFSEHRDAVRDLFKGRSELEPPPEGLPPEPMIEEELLGEDEAPLPRPNPVPRPNARPED